MSTMGKEQTLEDLLGDYATQAHERLKQGVALVTSANQSLASNEAAEVMGALQSLDEGSSGESPEAVFQRFCKSISAAFPAEHPSDEDILSFAYTPALMRFFVAAIKHSNGNPRRLQAAFKLKQRTAGTPTDDQTYGGKWIDYGVSIFDGILREVRTEMRVTETSELADIVLARDKALDRTAIAVLNRFRSKFDDQKNLKTWQAIIRERLFQEWFGMPGRGKYKGVKTANRY